MELELPVEAPAAILAEQQELLVAADQPAMKPHKRRCRKQLPALLPLGKMGNVTVEEAIPEEPVVCCASCQGQFPGVMLPSQRRCRWLCPDCRAQRRDFNREQRYYKQIGCGVCQACQMSQDCGICSVCVLRAKSPELRIGIKCLLRRCLKIVKKGLECGMCQACKITEDCGSCHICLRRHKPGMKRQWKCLKRRCLKRKKWKPTMERDPGGIPTVRQRKKQLGAVKERKKPGRPPKHPTAQLKNNVQTSASRRNRKCGKCEACLLKMDCGRCDFCCDKPKFGGRNLKRQKCRWRQCLHFAMESPSSREQMHLPRLQGPEEPEQQPVVKWKKEPEMSGSILAQDLAKDRPILPHVKEESEVPRHPTPPSQVLVKVSECVLS
uniref:CXXC-type domain-containing protein n=1 Tax=Podarcis muralis TaxID=64176 RepID=A0A670K590_PODMU